jgi:polyisoprenoid-binding protein YceI
MGHRLLLDVQDWSAQVEMAGGRPVAVSFRAALGSLHVESGTGGVTPLTVVDRQVIRRNAGKVLDVDAHPEVEFASDTVELTDTALAIHGDLTIHGTTLPLETTLTVEGRRVHGAIPVVQTEFGIRPYSAMLGQLKVGDEVTVEIDVTVPE